MTLEVGEQIVYAQQELVPCALPKVFSLACTIAILSSLLAFFALRDSMFKI